MNETFAKLKPQYELHLSGGKRALAIFLWTISFFAIVLSDGATHGTSGELSYLVPVLFPIMIFLFCKEHIELGFIPLLTQTLSSAIKSIVSLRHGFHIPPHQLGGYISVVITIALIVVIVFALYKKINPIFIKVLSIAFIVITLIQALIQITFQGTSNYLHIYSLIRLVCNGFAWFIVYLGIKQEEFTKINWTKLIVAVLIVAVAYLAFSGKITSNHSQGGDQWEVCHKCGGDGKVANDLGFNVSCPRCNGVGYLP